MFRVGFLLTATVASAHLRDQDASNFLFVRCFPILYVFGHRDWFHMSRFSYCFFLICFYYCCIGIVVVNKRHIMSDYPYVAVPNKLKTFLEDIKRLGVPERVNRNWLKTVGYTSSNDLSIPRVLEFIEFVDASRKPTEKWMRFRDRERSGAVLAVAILQGYSALYQILPDAHLRDDDDLRNFFSTQTEAGEQAVRRTANTFKTLCSMANFGEIQKGGTVPPVRAATVASADSPLSSTLTGQAFSPSLKIDLQINVASDASPEQIDQVFESLAKHLYKRMNKS